MLALSFALLVSTASTDPGPPAAPTAADSDPTCLARRDVRVQFVVVADDQVRALSDDVIAGLAARCVVPRPSAEKAQAVITLDARIGEDMDRNDPVQAGSMKSFPVFLTGRLARTSDSVVLVEGHASGMVMSIRKDLIVGRVASTARKKIVSELVDELIAGVDLFVGSAGAPPCEGRRKARTAVIVDKDADADMAGHALAALTAQCIWSARLASETADPATAARKGGANLLLHVGAHTVEAARQSDLMSTSGPTRFTVTLTAQLVRLSDGVVLADVRQVRSLLAGRRHLLPISLEKDPKGVELFNAVATQLAQAIDNELDQKTR